jgi:PEP-CTERM motif
MKPYTLQVALFLVMSFFLNLPVYGDQFAVSASATTFWDTLRVTTDPGVNISWLGTSDQTEVIHFFDSATVNDLTSANSTPLSYHNQMGGVATSGEATGQSISSSILWSNYPPSGIDWMNMQRQANFRVTGSGNVTFSIDYSLSAQRMVDASTLPYPRIETAGVVESDLLLYIPFVTSFAYDQHFMFIPDVNGSVSDSLSQNGTATVSYRVSDGETYWIRGETHSLVNVAAPEPSSLALLGFGLFGIVAVMIRNKTSLRCKSCTSE